MVVKTRILPAGSGADVSVAPAANLARELISADQVLQWTLEGRCFTGSLEPETGGVEGQTALNDQKADFMLTSDRGGTKLVVPITTQISLYDDDTATGEIGVGIYLYRPFNDTKVLRTVTGTDAHIINNRSDAYGTQTATLLYTVTSSILEQATDWVELGVWKARAETLEVAEHGFSDNSITINHLKNEAPIILHHGASISVASFADSNAPFVMVVFQWAELDASAYLP